MNLSHHAADCGGVRVHYVDTGGDGDVVVLLHGWPQTWREWRHLMPAFARNMRVIAPDLRGAGDSGRPLVGYDKRTMARDIIGLLDQLGIKRCFLVGHDFGAAVAYAVATQRRELVRGLVILDMIFAGFGYEEAMRMTPEGGGLWHFSFHLAQDIAETLIAGREREYLSYFFRNYAYNPDAISSDDVAEYARAYAAPGALRATLNWYRTVFQDAADNREAATQKLQMPVLAFGGEKSLGPMTGQMMEMLASNVQSGVVPRAGHWLPEERPDFLIGELEKFFSSINNAGARR